MKKFNVYGNKCFTDIKPFYVATIEANDAEEALNDAEIIWEESNFAICHVEEVKEWEITLFLFANEIGANSGNYEQIVNKEKTKCEQTILSC